MYKHVVKHRLSKDFVEHGNSFAKWWNVLRSVAFQIPFTNMGGGGGGGTVIVAPVKPHFLCGHVDS